MLFIIAKVAGERMCVVGMSEGMCVYMYVYVCMCVCMCVCVYVYVCM